MIITVKPAATVKTTISLFSNQLMER